MAQEKRGGTQDRRVGRAVRRKMVDRRKKAGEKEKRQRRGYRGGG